MTSLTPSIHLGCSDNGITAVQMVVSGMVQGVGFRPFVFRLASRIGLAGWVKNVFGHVVIHVEGRTENIRKFKDRLINESPPNALPLLSDEKQVSVSCTTGFHILASDPESIGEVSVPLDNYLCSACELELSDPGDRRFQYPFIACSDCGPRYSIVTRLPYDRLNTTMATFNLCEVCEEEYTSPFNRRLHAQPLACPSCGPRIELADGQGIPIDTKDHSVIESVVALLKKGEIIALKSVGGYHLICDASNDSAVARLRDKKSRPDRPFAVMFPSYETDQHEALMDRCVMLSELERHALMSDSRPIVLVKRRTSQHISKYVAKDLKRLGIMLPCSAIHHLILQKFGGPIVATSGNTGGEPIVSTRRDATLCLHSIVDKFVHHNRQIARPVDDSVVAQVANRISSIRLGRGKGPVELNLPFHIDEPILGVGAHQKNTVAIAWGSRLVVSPHIGDLNSPATVQRFENTVKDLQELYGVVAKQVVCDLHSRYTSSRWAQKQRLPCFTVQHHIAHASAWAVDVGANTNSLVFVWDGVGLGEDGNLWGGEVFWGKPGSWKRIVTFSPLRIQGADLVARQPWRSAAAMSWQTSNPWPPLNDCDPQGYVATAWKQEMNCHLTSSVGRLFDAAAATSLNIFENTYEAQGAIALEDLVEGLELHEKCVLECNGHTSWVVDWRPLSPMLFDKTLSAQAKAERFHAALIQLSIEIISTVGERLSFSQVGLTGGVFQNRVLVEGIINGLNRQGDPILLPERLPVNDASISAGQIVEYACRELL